MNHKSIARIIKLLGSVKIAVVIMLYLAVVTAVGTIIESKYDAFAARALVYDTVWMMVGLFALSVTLIAVMVDRWPWKKRHIPFLLAHVGILVLLFGSVLTMKFGLDGSMTIGIDKESRHVVLPHQTDVVVYASFGGMGMTKFFEKEVDFFRRPPTEESPLAIPTESDEIRITGYKPYVLPSKKVTASTLEQAGAGVRFQMTNERANVLEWLVQRNSHTPASLDLGPAKISLGDIPPAGSGNNEIWLQPDGDKLRWALFRKDSPHAAARGEVREGEFLKTGWMGLELRILRYHPKAQEEWGIEERETPTPLTVAAVRVNFRGRDQWLMMNDTLRLFTDSTAYLITYMHRRVDIGFPVKLKSFEKTSWEGTRRAKEYQSVVEFPELGDVTISMNNPAYYKRLTFYQASFQEDEQGAPVASVLSVNFDPGRWWKYIGSLIISLGVVWLFWHRRNAKTAG